MVAAAVAAASLAGSVLTSNAQSDAADTAANAQIQSSKAGIAEQDKMFQAVQKLLAPYATGGTSAFNSQQTLAGLNGNTAQAAAIKALQGSPAYTSALKAGNDSILAAASATGGLRGGNVQGALGQFAPALLAATINDQYGRLGGLAGLGENAAAGTGNAALSTGNNITGLLGGIGAAQAGDALAQGRAQTGLYSGFGSAIGQFLANPNLGKSWGGSSGGTGDPLAAWGTGGGSFFGGGDF